MNNGNLRNEDPAIGGRRVSGVAPQSTAMCNANDSTPAKRWNSAEAQRTRLLDALRQGPVDTNTAYRRLDILHVPSRVFELRKLGHPIKTFWTDHATEAGVFHRIGLYVLLPKPESSVIFDPVRYSPHAPAQMVEVVR